MYFNQCKISPKCNGYSKFIIDEKIFFIEIT